MQFAIGAALAKRVFISILSLSSASALASSDVDVHCSRIVTEGGLSIVTEACPIGEGLWGRNPSAKGGPFWVQCGVSSNQPNADEKASIDRALGRASQLLFRREHSQYRCLVGPFERHKDAIHARNLLRQSPITADAFIRQVDYPALRSTQGAKRKSSVAPANQGRSLVEIGGLWTPQPRSTDDRYTYGRQDWWRATFEEAKRECQNAGKRVVSEQGIRAAVESAKSEKFPNIAPYWLRNGQVYDIELDMSFVAISDTLVLNVLCE